jgi:hypothetical protein
VFVHGGLVGFVDGLVVLVPQLLYFGLHHAVVVVEGVVGVLGFADGQLQFFLYLFLIGMACTLEVMFSLLACCWAYYSSSASYSSSYSAMLDYSAYSCCFCSS